MSVERIPPPPSGGLGQGSMRKLSTPGRTTNELGWRPLLDGTTPTMTADGYGVLLFPSAECLRALAGRFATSEVGAPLPKAATKKALPAKATATIPKGSSVVVTASCVIRPGVGWAGVSALAGISAHAAPRVGAYGALPNAVLLPLQTFVPKGTEISPSFLVMAIDGDVTLDEGTPIGVACVFV